MLGLFHMNKEELIGEVPIESSLDCSSYEKMLFEILRKMSKKNSRSTTTSLWGGSLFLSALLGEILWDTVLKRKMALESWLTSQDTVLKTQKDLF